MYELYDTSGEFVVRTEQITAAQARQRNAALRRQGSSLRWILKQEPCPFTLPALNGSQAGV